ncbi:MAG: hypothetical protein ACI9A1_000489 [Lentimonas sp.]|jgi:hypothetical protein
MQQLLNKAKRLFLRLSVREKLLTLLFILVMLFFWAGNLLSRGSEWNGHRQLGQADLQVQQQILDRSDEFTVGLANALERVDPKKTYARAQLSGRIDSIVRQVSLSNQADIDPVKTEEGEIFNDHDVNIRLSRISIAQFIQLNKLLSQETPYITSRASA